MTSSRASILQAFQRIWGYSDFLPPQGEIINAILNKQDAIIIMPTGAGKSVCFQLPALIQTGLTIVISPLVALMENQVKELLQLGQKAALLHSELPSFQRRNTLQALEKQQLRLIYLSPETLLSPVVWEKLSQPQLLINALILDEAHCLAQWGTSFRPTYSRLGAVRPALLKSKPPGTKITIAAFTATADAVTQTTITTALQLHQPAIFRINPYRSNLNPRVRIVWTPKSRKQQLLNFIIQQTKKSNITGLIYVRTRQDSEDLTAWLTKMGYPTASYHAGHSPGERRQIESNWLSGKLPFVVCTSAFGMGINKSDVRWVVHFHPPLLISEYVQEIGRAGRDGKPAEVLTLVSEPTGFLNPGDNQRRKFFEQQIREQVRTAHQLIKNLPEQGEINATIKEFPNSAVALALLYSTGQLSWLDPFNYILSPQGQNCQLPIQIGVKEMTEYLSTKKCRWQFLLNAFDFLEYGSEWRCGHCDNCGTSRM